MRFLLLLACVAPLGCGRPKLDADPPGYELVIPDDVPEDLILVDKEGTQHEGNGRELYAGGHWYGWRQCWEKHQQGRVDPQDESAAYNYMPQTYGIVARGFADGFRACQRYLLQPR
jgi:hypothetical protein